MSTSLTEIKPGIFMLEMPMVGSRVKSINWIRLYIIRGKKRNLLFDTGINTDACYQPVAAAYEKLGISKENTDVFVSHIHPDHCGLVDRLSVPENSVYIHRKEAEIITELSGLDYWRGRHETYLSEGLPMSFEEFYSSHPAAKYFPEAEVEFECFDEGYEIDLGDSVWRCIVTPGHSPGHTCLYNEKEKILLGGDTILPDVAPIIFLEPGFDDPVGEFLKSMDYLAGFDVETFLPCHGFLEFDYYQRIEELKLHYSNKCQRIMQHLEEVQPASAWDMARLLIRDDIPKDLDQVSLVSRWFFFLPACTCMRYLEGLGKLTSSVNAEGVKMYRLL